MRLRFTELRCREVINIHDGLRLGFISDAVLDSATGRILSVVIPGRFKLFSREDDYIIPWESIRKIGDDIILVDAEGKYFRERPSSRGKQ